MKFSFLISVFLFLAAGLKLGAQTNDTIVCDSLVSVPLYVSSTGNGINNVFIPSFLRKMPSEFELSIYNKEGKMVFISNHLNEGWDGKSKKGKSQPAGTYFWMLTYKYSQKDELHTCKGTVTLLQ